MKTLTLEQALDALIDYRGKTPKKTNLGIPLVTAKIVKNGFILEPNEFIAEADYDTWMRRGIPKVGDVVLTTEAPLGEVAMIKNPSIALAQRIVTLRGKAGVLNNHYLKYFFMSPVGKEKLRERSSGTTVLGIKQSELRKIEIVLPDFPVQEKIADVLSVYDDLIENNNRRIKILKEMAQKIYTEWFVNFRFPGHEKAKLGKNGLPDGWKRTTLGEITQVSRGFSYKREYMSKTGIPLLTMGVVSPKNRFNYPNLKFYSPEKFEKKYELHQGDLVVCSHDVTQDRLIIGCPAIVPSDLVGPIMMGTNLYGVSVKDPTHKPIVYYEMLTSQYRAHMVGRAKGTNILFINKTDVEEYQMVLADTELLNRFNQFISPVDSEIDSLSLMQRNLITARDLLIPQLVTGKLEVKV